MLQDRSQISAALRRIAGDARTEATLQGEIQHLLLLLGDDLNLGESDLEITLESRSGSNRIDVEVGHVCIEVKKQLGAGRSLDKAIDQLGGYLEERSNSLGQRYVGVLTDGSSWLLYHLSEKRMLLVDSLQLNPANPDVTGFVEWLAGVLATEEGIAPTSRAIETRLGAHTVGHSLEYTSLLALYAVHGTRPELAIKRELWAKLLTTALGTQFHADDHDLFVEHTLLVATAEAIAHAVLGFDIRQLDAQSLLSGELFSRRALILGVVERDFFDWPLDCGEEGRRWVSALAKRLAQFDWSRTHHDAMKTIYESVITPETRKSLGEYYTPDFLAEHMVEKTVHDPLTSRVLDPACGSGTFLFHAVRHYLAAADLAGHDNATALNGLLSHVAGVDLHPVAVTLARVTYLLAIGSKRLQAADRPPIRIPVYIGDSLQWGQRQDLFSAESFNVPVRDELTLLGNEFVDQLRFPQSLLGDTDRFDQLVVELADAASNRPKGSAHPVVGPIARRHGLSGADLELVAATFEMLCRLHDEGRDHIWSYFVRNLARPAWFAREANRADVIIGNPPWLAYRFMTSDMQERFRAMSTLRGLWVGGSVATHQDLSDLFVVRAIEQYLRTGGRFCFVMPAGVLTRRQYEGFRRARWDTAEGLVSASFDQAWDLSMVYPYFFPRTCAVVQGERSPATAGTLSNVVERWSGSIPDPRQAWSTVQTHLIRKLGDLTISRDGPVSPYHGRFTEGAIISPRVLTTVLPDDSSPVGTGAGRIAVRSDRGVYEKRPWKDVPDLRGVVGTRFVYPLLLGQSVLPFRQLEPPMAVLPVNSGGSLVDPDDDSGLADWWGRASQIWERHRTSSLTLMENVDYRRKLTSQFPLARHRVVVTHSGMHVAACRIIDAQSVVEHQLDWATMRSEEEGLYLCSILNSPVVTTLAAPYMTSGKGGGRHIGKSLWKLRIPLFDPDDPAHIELVKLGRTAEGLVSTMELPSAAHGIQRRAVRAQLASSETGRAMDSLVGTLLDDGVS